jgi:hypothetical protein
MAYDTIAQAGPAAGATSPNEVAIWMNFGADSIEYQVPAGKIFKGWLVAHDSSTSPTYTYTPGPTSTTGHSQMGNNGSVLDGTFYHTSTGFESKWPMMMNAGDKIRRRSSHSWTLMGLETTVNTVSWDTSS